MEIKKKKSFFGRMSEKISDAIKGRGAIDDDLLDELEEILITSDIGMQTTMKVIEQLRYDIKSKSLNNSDKVKEGLAEIIEGLMDKGERNKLLDETPIVITMIGINGGGKTTTIGKLTNMLKKQGKTVVLAAADTFRAAAADQLAVWGERTSTSVVRHKEGADPSAVIFDAIQSAKAKNADVLICDTAGRLQTKKNLMAELEKMNKVIDREWPEAARETILVLDATTGKNAISQAQEFGAVANLTGIIITKLDGTAKGGIAVTIADEFDMAIKFVGVGEGIDDLRPFVAKEFVGGIFNE